MSRKIINDNIITEKDILDDYSKTYAIKNLKDLPGIIKYGLAYSNGYRNYGHFIIGTNVSIFSYNYDWDKGIHSEIKKSKYERWEFVLCLGKALKDKAFQGSIKKESLIILLEELSKIGAL